MTEDQFDATQYAVGLSKASKEPYKVRDDEYWQLYTARNNDNVTAKAQKAERAARDTHTSREKHGDRSNLRV